MLYVIVLVAVVSVLLVSATGAAVINPPFTAAIAAEHFKRADRREVVRQQLAVDGDDLRLPCGLRKLGEIWEVASHQAAKRKGIGIKGQKAFSVPLAPSRKTREGASGGPQW